MFSPDFDNLIRGKLNAVSPQYTPSDWQRIRRRLPGTGNRAWFLAALPWLLTCFSTTLFVVVLYHLRELRSETSQMRNLLNKASIQIGDAKREIGALIQNQEHQNDLIRLLKKQKDSESGQNINSAYAAGLKEGISRQWQMSDLRKPYNSTGLHANVGYGKQSGGFRQNLTNPSQTGERNRLSQTSASDFFPMHLPVSPVNTSSKAPILDSALSKTDSAKREPIILPKKKEVSDVFRLANLKPRLGFEIFANRGGTVGLGPSLELLITPSVGFQFGILASQGRKMRFFDTRDFNNQIHAEFESVYGDQLGSDPGEIREIEIYTSYVELPVRVKYYISMGNRLSLIPFAGTHFDLSASERVRCEQYHGHRETYYSFTRKNKTTFFHTYNFGFGAQWKGEKIAWQLAPSYTFNFRQSTLYEPTHQWGANLSIWIPLFKN